LDSREKSWQWQKGTAYIMPYVFKRFAIGRELVTIINKSNNNNNEICICNNKLFFPLFKNYMEHKKAELQNISGQ